MEPQRKRHYCKHSFSLAKWTQYKVTIESNVILYQMCQCCVRFVMKNIWLGRYLSKEICCESHFITSQKKKKTWVGLPLSSSSSEKGFKWVTLWTWHTFSYVWLAGYRGWAHGSHLRNGTWWHPQRKSRGWGKMALPYDRWSKVCHGGQINSQGGKKRNPFPSYFRFLR